MTDQNHKLDNPNNFDGITIDVNPPIESTDNKPCDPPSTTKESIDERVGTTAEEMRDNLNYYVIRRIYSDIYEKHKYKHDHELQVPPISEDGFILFEKDQCKVVFRYLTGILSIEDSHICLNKAESALGHIIRGEVEIKERIKEKVFTILMGDIDLSSLEPDPLTIKTHPVSLDSTIRESKAKPSDNEKTIADKIVFNIRSLISLGVNSVSPVDESRVDSTYKNSVVIDACIDLSKDEEFIKRVMDAVISKLR